MTNLRSVKGDMTTTAAELPGYDAWLEKPYQDAQAQEAECPNCRESVSVHDERCPHCGHDLTHDEPDYDSMLGGHDNPVDRYEDHWAHTSKFHILGDQVAPGQVGQGGLEGQVPMDTPGGLDHSRVDQMSEAQMGAHQRLVNYAVTKINDAITQGSVVDASFLENLKLDVTNQFGIPAQEAETIVDDAMRQSQNQDGTLDQKEPPPVEQTAPPADNQADPGVAGGVGQGPEPVPVANGAFQSSSLLSRRGLPAHVAHTWTDIYGDDWAELHDTAGYRESVLVSEIKTGKATANDPVAEIRTFLRDTQPAEFTKPEIRARISNLKLATQEIRKLIANKKVSDQAAAQLDDIQADAEVELLNLTDALPALDKQIEPEAVQAIFDVPDHTQPSLYGMDEISVLDTEPEIASEDIESAIPEEAATFVADHPEVGGEALLSMAASHIDAYTAGHSAEVRAHHRSAFTRAVKEAAQVSAPKRNTKVASTEEDLSLYDGPAEAIFLS